MQSLLHRILRVLLRFLVRPLLSPRIPFRLQRKITAAQARLTLAAKGTTVESTLLGGVGGELIRPAEGWREGSAVLYLHGGGYCIGSARVQRPIASHIARFSGADVHSIDYRLAPEDPYPAAVDDAFAAYRALLATGIEPRRVAIAGDSAGAGLAVSVALEIDAMELPPPGALVLLCPWVDLTNSAASIKTNAGREPLLRADWLNRAALTYAGGRRPQDAGLSPLFADLRGLPPTLIQVGGDDLLYDDGVRFHARAEAAGVDSTLDRHEGMWHDFQLNAGLLKSADEALESVGDFLKRRLAR